MKQEFIEKPWGSELIWAKTDKYVGKVITIWPGKRLSLQFHREKMETIYVTEGILQLDLKYGKDIYTKTLHKGESYHIVPNTIHRFCCPGNSETPVVLMEVSTTELQDVVRLEDDFGREDAKL